MDSVESGCWGLADLNPELGAWEVEKESERERYRQRERERE